MKKKKKLKQGISVPLWLKQSLRLIERFSPEMGMRVAAHIFSKPLKFKLPEKERKALVHCHPELVTVPEINETIMCFEWKNKGEKVLLAHGWSGRGTQLYAIAESLHKKGYHVISFDAPAHGKSTGKITNMLQWGVAIKTLNNHYGEFDIYIGHSLGSMAILKYCEQASNAKKIITIGSGDQMRTIFDNFIMSVGLKPKTSERMKTYFQDKYNININEYDASYVVRQQQTPTLIIHDEDDLDINVSCAKNIHKQHPNATLMVTKGLGHRRILRDEKVIQKILSFIQAS
ncbi:MAG: alpha/beta hydrolase [Flavobacteriaceae bacterium]|jgi:pimeloyl-ACP methyl ester carboxylesterase|nr:alpha/beta hydrolase [Flavobacteriaceae bacterium]MDG2290160.1 alpha/beta hydrolase [Flavobacteriaceae bacterium]